jgi:hypothetical protein
METHHDSPINPGNHAANTLARLFKFGLRIKPLETKIVDMSPAAIMQRLEMVGQLNDLCRFLQTGQRPIRSVGQQPDVVAEPWQNLRHDPVKLEPPGSEG